MAEQETSFEAALKRLDEIVRQMEQGNSSLEDSLRLFEEGTDLVRQCGAQLDQEEQKIVRLMKGPDGMPVEMEFEDGN